MVSNVLYFLLISLSVSYMWSFSEIFGHIRSIMSKIPYIRKPFLCPVCSAFWFGLGCSFLYNPITLNNDYMFASNLIAGLITHLTAVVFYKHIGATSLDGKIDMRGRMLRTKSTEWNEFYLNISQQASFNTFTVTKDGDDLFVFFS